ncbi:MAG: beta-ketoacyl synthase chain length factor [Treponema sp.]|nr:beta-ketoacyl synthase chain length factor [Treponema sp.]
MKFSAAAANTVYCSSPSCWAPGLDSAQDWYEWACGTKHRECTNDAPALEFTPPLFRRRLGQLCRMTVQVVHDALEQTGCGDIKQVFVSCRGDISREFAINKQLIQENSILPASFSLSVFNAPIALATIACGLKSGYSVIFPSKGNFASAFFAACAPVLCGHEQSVLFVYGDEVVPECYGSLCPQHNVALSFATVISAQTRPQYGSIPVAVDNTVPVQAELFLKSLIIHSFRGTA